MKTINPRKQRKNLYNAPLHKKRKWLSSHLAENLLLKYDKRSIPVIEGDTVKVMRGSFKGHEDKIAQIHVHKQIVEVEGITTVKADGTKIAKPVHPSNLLVTKLNLTDKWRRKKLERGLSEETRKEIEIEAEEQIKEQEDEQRLKEEEELEEIPEELEEPLAEEKSITKTQAPKEKEEKKEVKKSTKPKKTPPKKGKTATPKKTTQQKKKPTKKASSQKTKTKEEEKK